MCQVILQVWLTISSSAPLSPWMLCGPSSSVSCWPYHLGHCLPTSSTSTALPCKLLCGPSTCASCWPYQPPRLSPAPAACQALPSHLKHLNCSTSLAALRTSLSCKLLFLHSRHCLPTSSTSPALPPSPLGGLPSCASCWPYHPRHCLPITNTLPDLPC